MVFGFFKKKKPQQQATPNPQQNAQKGPSPSKSNVSPQRNAPLQDNRAHLTEEEQWMYDTVVQFLMSPSWRIPILTFIDDNCMVFDDEEENKFEYTDIHNQFKKLIEGLVQDMLAELEIEEDKLANILQAGIQDHEYRKIFEQLLVTENFLVFKSLMVKRNKELELEALQQLEELEQRKMEQSKTNYAPPAHMNPQNQQSEIARVTAEKEQAEINHAIQLSLAVEQERQKLLQQEDYELQEALRQSQSEYKKHQEGLKSKEAEKKRELEKEKEREREREREKEKQKQMEAEKEKQKQLEAEKQKQRQLEDEKEKQRQQAEKDKEREKEKEKELAKLAKIKADAEAQKKLQESQQQAQTQAQPSNMSTSTTTTTSTVIEEQKVQGGDLQTSKKLAPIQGNTKSLPPLMEESKINPNSLPPIKGSANYKPEQETEDALTSYRNNAEQGKSETADERKARLKAQRDLILAKKKAEREAELNNYEAQKGKNKPAKNEEKLTNEEIEKRKEVYNKLKGEI